jgi:hypothetical protein
VSGVRKPWYETNPIHLTFLRLEHRVQEAIDGDCRFLIVCGPPGIAKSEKIQSVLHRYSEKLRAIRDAQPLGQKGDRRTTRNEDTDEDEFRPPYYMITGRASHPQVHCRMFWASQPGEVFFCDDVASLRDKKNQELFQMASDPTHRYIVQYNYHRRNLPDDRVPVKYVMRGSMICVNNFNRLTDGGMLIQLFEPQVLDRAVQLHFSFERAPLYEYVTNMAFGADPSRGLLRFVFAPRARDQVGESGGCGWTGVSFNRSGKAGIVDPEKLAAAKKMLVEVREFFHTNRDRTETISFRILRRITYDRFVNPTIWRNLAEDHLQPRKPTEPQHQGDRLPAFAERPG